MHKKAKSANPPAPVPIPVKTDKGKGKAKEEDGTEDGSRPETQIINVDEDVPDDGVKMHDRKEADGLAELRKDEDAVVKALSLEVRPLQFAAVANHL
jgi:hypothetical protein